MTSRSQNSRSVLITGTSSGLGRVTAEYLATKDYYVYAGVRRKSDFQSLAGKENIQPVKLDVTSSDDISSVFETISRDKNFYALINNGIIKPAPLLETSEQQLHQVIKVNLYGALRLIQMFYPLLERSTSHIINISSVNGSAPSPRDGGYSISKHALEVLIEQLEHEVKSDINLSILQPALFDTAMVEKLKKQLGERADKGEEWAQQLLEFYDRDEVLKDPIQIAKTIEHILSTDNPAFRYAIGTLEEENWAIENLVSRIIQTRYSNRRSEEDIISYIRSRYKTT